MGSRKPVCRQSAFVLPRESAGPGKQGPSGDLPSGCPSALVLPYESGGLGKQGLSADLCTTCRRGGSLISLLVRIAKSAISERRAGCSSPMPSLAGCGPHFRMHAILLPQVSCMSSTPLTRLRSAGKQLTLAPRSWSECMLLMSATVPHASSSAPTVSGLTAFGRGELLEHLPSDAMAFSAIQSNW